jgi:hypothetical protein
MATQLDVEHIDRRIALREDDRRPRELGDFSFDTGGVEELAKLAWWSQGQ